MAQSDSPMPERRITDADLDRHDELREVATAGPWVPFPLGSEGYAVNGPKGAGRGGHHLRIPRVAFCGHEEWETDKTNAAYIATLANDDAAMCAEVRRLRELLSKAFSFTIMHDPYRCSRLHADRMGYDDTACDCYVAEVIAALAQPDAEAPR